MDGRNLSLVAIASVVVAAVSAVLLAAPSVYPTGTTIYHPDKTWNGYTVLSALGGQSVIVIDMNGNIVKRWEGYNNSAGGPARILPGGVVVAAAGSNPPHQESVELIQRDFDGKVLWRFDHNEQVTLSNNQEKGKQDKGTPVPADQEGKTIWSLRQHHDWQRDDFPAGYYAPGVNPRVQGSNTLVLTHTNHIKPKVSKATLEDDRILEISWEGKVLWQWLASDHIDDFHFDKDARDAIASSNAMRFDWLHVNAAAYVGPNHWYDEGDKRFAPNNVIISSREASLIAIIARDGSIVWQMGPDYSASAELRTIRQVIGQHNAHIIPKGLPGAGNLLVFDNGGPSGYGKPTSTAPNGQNIFARASSRVLEIDPVSLKLVWSYTGTNFYASNISGAQRLPNGNTLITEGPSGRVFEVTTDSTIVWEYVYPQFSTGARPSNSVYRAYRLPYEWIPQITKPTEKAITPPSVGEFRVP